MFSLGRLRRRRRLNPNPRSRAVLFRSLPTAPESFALEPQGGEDWARPTSAAGPGRGQCLGGSEWLLRWIVCTRAGAFTGQWDGEVTRLDCAFFLSDPKVPIGIATLSSFCYTKLDHVTMPCTCVGWHCQYTCCCLKWDWWRIGTVHLCKSIWQDIALWNSYLSMTWVFRNLYVHGCNRNMLCNPSLWKSLVRFIYLSSECTVALSYF